MGWEVVQWWRGCSIVSGIVTHKFVEQWEAACMVWGGRLCSADYARSDGRTLARTHEW